VKAPIVLRAAIVVEGGYVVLGRKDRGSWLRLVEEGNGDSR